LSYPINFLVVDLSHWDPAADYDKAKAAGVVGVIYKASQGANLTDGTYTDQRAKAKKAGLLWGAYHFGDNSNVTRQVDSFIAAADLGPGDLFCLDYEPFNSQMSYAQAKAFVMEVESSLNRYSRCVLYSGNQIKENLVPEDQIFWAARRLWLAQYASQPVTPAPWAKPWLWQYTDGEYGPEPHTVPGCDPSGIDCNSYDGTPDQLKSNWA
jgi:lysozyme